MFWVAYRPLQCGHGVSAVENPVAAPPTRPPRDALQCGHGVSAVENPGTTNTSSLTMRASMLPRRHSRGEQAAQRGVSAVENSERTFRALTARACFNVATASQPWRTASVQRPPASPALLQCGHGVSAVENAALALALVGAREASMWPRRLSRGELGD